MDFNQFSDPDKALQASRKSAADGIYQLMEMRAKERAAAEVRANGTKGRLITQHKGPNTDPTPGADYKGHDSADLKKAFDETHAHAISQWQAGQGVVGPTGEEGTWKYSWANDRLSSGYEENQNFAYQHDMQATDADLQAKTPEQRKEYDTANRNSAVAGFVVLKKTGSVSEALKETQKVFKGHGFDVRQSY